MPGPGRVRTAIWTCAGRGGIGRARASALGGGRPRGGRVGCGGVPEARRMWRQIDIRNVRAATRPGGSKAAWIARQKAKGKTANAQIAESTGVKAGRAQPCGPAPPPLASRHPIPAAHGQAVGRPAGAPRARRGSRAAATARRARPHQAARGPQRGTVPASRARGAGPARPAWCTLSAARIHIPHRTCTGQRRTAWRRRPKRWSEEGAGTARMRQASRRDHPGSTPP